MELIKRIYLNASNENRNREITKGNIYINAHKYYFIFYIIINHVNITLSDS